MIEPRLHCYRCDKPQSTCVCDNIPRLDNQTGVSIVQHPRERRHPLGTARFAELGLQHVRRLVDVEGRYRGANPSVEFPAATGVLFPSPDAVPLPEPGTPDAPKHLIVIDGTWHQAKTLYRDMVWLHQFPHYVLNPQAPSRYRIRREPKHSYISTLEALLVAIAHLEPDLKGIEQLLVAFDAMIDRQIDCEREASAHRERLPRRQADFRRKPRALAEHFGALVLLYAETTPDAGSARRLTYFCAHRLRDGHVFERWIGTPESPIPESTLNATLAQSRARNEQCVDPITFDQQWREFVEDQDVFAAWGPNTLRFLAAPYKKPAGRAVLLKAAYGSFRPGQGALETIIQTEGLQCKPPPVPGRGGERLSHARAVAELLHERLP